MINKTKKVEWIFCYWDDPIFNEPNKTENENKNNTRREKDFNKTKRS